MRRTRSFYRISPIATNQQGRVVMKKSVICATAAVLLTGISFTMFVGAEPRAPEAAKAPRVAVPGAPQATIDRGRYLVKITGCNDCHTPNYGLTAGKVPENEWLTGDTVGWQGEWGTTFPINLRLFLQTLTPEQWLVIARSPARPPMPWFALRDMNDADLLSIYHYVRSLG